MELEKFDKKIESLENGLKQLKIDRKEYLLSLLSFIKKGDTFPYFNHLGEPVKDYEIRIINITKCNISYHNGTYNQSKPHNIVIEMLLENTTFGDVVKRENRNGKLKELGII